MNLSASIMLVDRKSVRPVKVEYDPDNKYNNNPMKFFKTIDLTIKVGDLVIVQTHTRHGFTVAKVTEVDFPIDFYSNDEWGWIGQRFDKVKFDEMVKIEDGVKSRVAEANENKMRDELKAAMGLGSVSFSDLDIQRLNAPTPVEPAAAPITPPGA